MTSTGLSTRGKLPDLLLPLVLAFVGLAVTLPALDPFFNPEDQILLANARTAEQVVTGFLEGDGIEYRPAHRLWLYLQALVFGEEARAYYLVAFALHGVTAGLLFGVARGLAMSRSGATLAGLVLACHPAAAQVVTWLADQSLLVMLGVLVSVLSWMRFRSEGGPWAYAGALGGLALALFSEESAALLPLVLVAYDATRSGSQDFREQWRAYVPVGLLWIGVGALSLRAAALHVYPAAVGYGPGPHSLANLAVAVRALVLPGLEIGPAPSSAGWVALGILTLAGLALLAVLSGGFRRFLMVWLLLALGPLLLRADAYRSFANGRYVYLALAPFALALGARAGRWLDAGRPGLALRRRAVGAVLVFFVLAFWARGALQVSAESHRHSPPSVFYQYVVAHLAGFEDAEAFLAHRTRTWGPREWQEVLLWASRLLENEAADEQTPADRRRHFAFVAHLARGLAAARLGDLTEAERGFDAALRAARGVEGLSLLRGDPVPSVRAAELVAEVRARVGKT